MVLMPDGSKYNRYFTIKLLIDTHLPGSHMYTFIGRVPALIRGIPSIPKILGKGYPNVSQGVPHHEKDVTKELNQISYLIFIKNGAR